MRLFTVVLLKYLKLSVIKMPARILNGKVSKKLDSKTIVVDVVCLVRHPLYLKVLKKHKKYMCHVNDENSVVDVGDLVSIVESPPISKRKKWKLLSSN